MSNTQTLQQLQSPQVRESSAPAVTMGFANLQSFELMQRAAKVLSSSTLVPTAYRAFKEIKEYGKVTGYEPNSAGLPNCIVALNMAQRMGADPLMVMQNLHIIEGRPSWSSTFIIAAINSCGRYSPLRFELSAAGEPVEVDYIATEWQKVGGQNKKVDVPRKVTVRHQTCKAWAIEKETGERLESPVVSIQMAIDEGWLTKNGSKWQTIPELMLRYRCASFFGRLYAPELLMGLQTAEEVNDFIQAEPDGQGGWTVDSTALRAQAEAETPASPPPVPDAEDEVVDTSTGEIRNEKSASGNTKPEKRDTSAEKADTKPEKADTGAAQGAAQDDTDDFSME